MSVISIERSEGYGFDPLHSIVPEPAEGPDSVDSPRRKAARTRSFVADDADKLSAFRHQAFARGDRDDPIFGGGGKLAVLAPAERNGSRHRIERIGVIYDASELSSLFEGCEGEFEPLRPGEVTELARFPSIEVKDVNPRRYSASHGHMG
jgi:hypothetical protein